WTWGDPAVLAVLAGWLAVLWLVFAWVGRLPGLFLAFQIALSGSVCLAVAAWLERQPWVLVPLDLLSDPRSLQAYGVGLAWLCLLWVLARLRLRSHERAPELLQSAWPAADRVTVVLLVLGLLGSVVWGVLPDVLYELTPASWLAASSATAAQLDATGPGAWLLLGSLVLVLITSLWGRQSGEAAMLLGFVALAVPTLTAGQFRAEVAVASDLRWGLAFCYLACSGLVWLRAVLRTAAQRLGSHWD